MSKNFTVKVMKLTIVLWFAVILQASAGVSAQKISLNVKNAGLEQVLDLISRQSGFNFIYNSKMLRVARPVNLTIRDIPLAEALSKCFEGQPLTFVLNGNTVVIKERPAQPPVVSTTPPPAPPPLKGVVTDDKGVPLAGVSVHVRGTTGGTQTDANGSFSINVPDGNAVLEFSFVGYTAQEVPVRNRTELNITLHSQPSALNEIVVIGYGTSQKKDLLSAVSTVKGSDFEHLPVATPQSFIQGRASGVQVVQNSGQPGSAVTVRIRGTTSINAGNDPLYIVDGVPVESGSLSSIGVSGSTPSALAAIDPDDIESMDVLKDAGALAIYGSRAANGVVLITTKHGKKGATSYNLNYYHGLQKVDRVIPMMNSTQAIEVVQEGRANALADGVTSVYGWILPDSTGKLYNTNWQKAIFRTAPVSDYELAIRGGEDKLRFALSGSYLDQDGVIIKSAFKRASARLNLDYDASRHFKLGSNLAVSRYINYQQPTEDGGLSLIQVALKKSPSMPVYNPDGSFYNGDVSGFLNPVAYANLVRSTNQVTSLIGNVYGDYSILPGLNFRMTWGMNYAGVLENFFEPSTAERNGVAKGSVFTSDVLGWINENTLNYTKTFGQHKLTGLLGYSQQERSAFGVNAAGTQYATNNIYTLNAAVMPTQASTNNSAYGLSSAFGRVGYAYGDKYLLEASARRDGSSRFGANKRYAIFPAVSAGWRISNEDFWNIRNVINDLKLRGSIGRTGNQTIGDYIAQGQYSTGASYVGQSGIALTTLPNPDLTWETTWQYDAGLDIALLKSRIIFNVDAYVKKTSNLLLNVPLPSTSSFPSILKNVGATQNKGIEFNLNTVNVTSKSFSWNSNLNISLNRNKVTQLYNNVNNIILGNIGQGLSGSLVSYSILQVGQPIGSFYGWKEDGVYQYSKDNSSNLTSTSIGTNGYVFKGGDLKFRDMNKNGTIDINDRIILGNPQPKFTGGFNNTFTYKGFDLGILITFSYGNHIVNGTRYTVEAATGFSDDINLLRRWRKEGDLTDIPRVDYADPAGNKRFSNRWIEDGSYARLKTVTLGYKLPLTLISRYHLQSLRVYASSQNLLTLTKYTGYDPEESSFYAGTNIGVDQGTYPQYRSFTFGINVGF